MDHSSLTEAQQQQQYQEHQQAELAQQHQQQLQLYQQHQNQDYSSQPYDPSQVQAYDQSAMAYDQSAQAYNQSAQAYNQSAQAYNQSAQAYYPYYQYQQPQQSQQPQQHQQQQQYQYYQPDYGNVYQQPAHHQQPQQELGPVQPPGVSVSQEAPPPQSVEGGGAGSGHGQVHVQHQQNAYYPQGGGEQQSSGFPLPPGLNPAAAAAVAALSQLTQFAGTMDAAERAMAGLQARQWHGKGGGYRPMMGPGHGPGAFHGHGPMHHGRGPMRPPAGRSPYRGGGRRGGGGPFRGGGRGNFGPRHPFRGGGSGPPFRGRGRGWGRGRGGSRRFAPYGVSSSSHPESAAVQDAELPEEEGEPSGVPPEEAGEAVVRAETSPSTVAPGDSDTNWQPSQVAWCELCRVDCTSLEILEQHKNGKRHKKNLQRIEELKSANLTGSEIPNEPVGESNFQPEIAQEGEEESDEEGEENPEKNLPSEAIADENGMESEQQNDIVEQPEKPMEERSDSQVGKPKMEHFDNWRRGMKRRMRGGRGGKRMKMFEAPRRPIEPPKPKVVIPLICDLCNVKCDTQEVFDRHLSGKKHIAKLKRFEGHQAMYGPMGLQALYPPNPIAQTLLHPQGHQQQGFYGPPGSFPPQGPYMPPQVHQAAPPAAGAVTQFQQNAIPEGSEAHSGSVSQAVVSVVHEPQQQFAAVESGTKESVTGEMEMNHVNGIPESGGNGLNPPQDNSVTRVEQGYAATHETAPLPDSGVTADHVNVPGLDMQPKEGAAE